MIAASLQRRVSVGGFPQSFVSAPSNIYPNMYVIFIAEPGIGKTQAGSQAKYLFSSFDKPDKDGNIKQIIKRGPDSITVEALTRYLHTHYTMTKIPKEVFGEEGKIYTHSSLALFCSDELGALLRENTIDLVTFLNLGWDCGDFHRETKTAGIDIVKNMCITLLGSATPSWVKENVSSRILSEGFSARCVFVYAGAKRKQKFLYTINEDQRNEMQHVRNHVEKLAGLYGQVRVSPEVAKWCDEWYEQKFKVVNNSKFLKEYYGRKKVHLIKLAMCMHFADSVDMELTVKDYEKALAFLEETEVDMDRALSSAGANPIYGIATSIVNYLEKRHTRRERHNQLVVEFYNEGNLEQLTEALQFLVTTGKVESMNGEKGLEYQLKQRE